MPRLVLDRLELRDFKSYAGKVIVGPFHQHFSAIVGPNGSGKSNIIDAMLFVFGRRAAQLRHKTVTDLIHHGSTYKPNSASVAVYMSNMEDTTGTREPAFCVARCVNSDGSTKYTIDGHTVGHGDMVKFLLNRGIDLEHNRFLILQGEVEQLALMPPKAKKETDPGGFLEILEDIIGTNSLIAPIQEKDVILEEIRTNYEECLKSCISSKREIDLLRGPCEAAASYVRFQKRIYIIKAKMEVTTILTLNQVVQTAEAQLNNAVVALAAVQTDAEAHRKNLQLLCKTLQDKESQLRSVNLHHKKVHDECEDLNIKDAKLELGVERSQKMITEEEAQITSLETSVISMKSEIENIAAKAKVAEADLPKVEKDFETIQKDMKAFDASLSAEYEALSNKKASCQAILDELQKAVTTIHSQVVQKKAEYSIRGQKLTEDENLVETLSDKLKSKKEEIKTLNKVLSENEFTFQNSCLDQNTALKRLKELQSLSEQKQARKSEVERLIWDTQKPIQAHSKVYHELKKAFGTKGNLIYQMGRFLWDLFDITEADINKYGAALTAAGFNSEPVVVDDEKTAQAIVDYVKTNRLGRVDCCVSTKMIKVNGAKCQAWMNQIAAEGYPNQCKPVMSLVKFRDPGDSKYLPLFFRHVGDSLILEGTTDVVNRARGVQESGNWRVVTLDGQVYEKSGNVAGGSAINHFKMRNKPFVEKGDNSLNLELAKLEEEIRNLKLTMRTTELLVEEAVQKIERATKNIQQTKESVDSQNESLSRIERQLHDVQTKQKQSVEKSAAEQQDVRKLEAEIMNLEAHERRQSSKLQEQQKQVDRIHENIENLGGPKKKSLIDSVANLEKRLKECRNLTNNAACMIQEVNEKIRGAKETILKKTDLIKSIQEDIQQKGQERERLFAVAAKKVEELDSAAANVTEETTILNDLKSEKVQMEQKIRVKSTEEMEKRSICDEIKSDISKKSKLLKQKQEIYERLSQDFSELPPEPNDLFESTVKTEEIASKPGAERSPDPGDIRIKKEVGEPVSSRRLGLEKLKFPGIEPVLENTGELELQLFHAEGVLRGFSQKHRKKGAAEDEFFMDLGILKQFESRAEAYKSSQASLEDVNLRMNALVEQINEMKLTRKNQFHAGFLEISQKVKEIYQMLTLGGDAELEWKDPANPFTEGVEFSVRPPGKAWRTIQNLSGGEKTLSSLALIFALHHYKPTPIYFLDEIDAALDPNNVLIIASYVAAYRDAGAQFVVISLRHQFFERADRLIGVCKIKGATRICVLDPDGFIDKENQP